LAELTEKGPVLINFWATWCAVCAKEIPHLNRLKKKYGKKGLSLIAVNYKDSEKKVEGFLKKHSFDFPVLLDTDGHVTEDLYGLFGLPSTAVVDTSGAIVYSSPEPPVEKDIDTILAKTGSSKKTDLPKYGLKTGIRAPGFKVKTCDDKTYGLKKELKKGPVVLVFYRGGWCPYCSTQLRDLQQNLKEFKKRGATLAALSVDAVENAKETHEKEKLGFPLLSDPDAEVLEKYRLAFKLGNKSFKQYRSSGIDIEKASGRKHHQIAVPAVFVIDTGGIIHWAYVNEDYKVRAKIEDILKALDALKQR
ncbi:MAG: redoxin domain-containing protein, partial [bacterium]